jgi:hypothetical protein
MSILSMRVRLGNNPTTFDHSFANPLYRYIYGVIRNVPYNIDPLMDQCKQRCFARRKLGQDLKILVPLSYHRSYMLDRDRYNTWSQVACHPSAGRVAVTDQQGLRKAGK